MYDVSALYLHMLYVAFLYMYVCTYVPSKTSIHTYMHTYVYVCVPSDLICALYWSTGSMGFFLLESLMEPPLSITTGGRSYLSLEEDLTGAKEKIRT